MKSSLRVLHPRRSWRSSCLIPLLALAVVIPVPGASLDAADAVQIVAGLSAVRLTEDAWVVTSDAPWSANVLVVRMADGTVVLADTPPNEKWTLALLDWIDRRFTPLAVVAVNSHFHLDAMGGNRVLLERRIPVWGSALTRELVRTKAPGMLAELRRSVAGTDDDGLFDQTELLPPDHTVPDGESKTLEFGAQEVVILDPGPAHAPDNVVVWFPDQRILFGGCMVKSSDSAGYLGDASLDHWPLALDRLQALDATWVVPGHGQRFDPGILSLTKEVVRKAARSESD